MNMDLRFLPTRSPLSRESHRRRRVAWASVLAVLALAAVTAASVGSAATRSERAKTKLTVWVAQDYPAIDLAAKRFEKAHPNVDVRIQITSGNAFQPKTRVAVASKHPPDLFQNFGGGNLLKSFINLHDVAPLTGFLKANKTLASKYLPWVLGPVTINGQIYGVPYQGVQPVFFYYNKAVFANAKITPPKTWSDLFAAIKTLKAGGVIPIAQGNEPWAEMMWPEYLALRAGGASAGNAVVAGKPGNSTAVRAAGDLTNQLLAQDPFEPGFLGIPYLGGEPTSLVGTGRAAMELQGSWDFSNFQSKTPDVLSQNNLGFFAFPALSSNPSTASAVAGNPSIYLSIAQKSQNKTVAMKFLRETLMQPWFAQELISEGAIPPVKGVLADLKKYAKGPEGFDFLKFQYTMLSKASYFQQSWDQASLPSQNTAIYDAVSNLLAGKLNGVQFATAMNG
jgi:raffinose/stachyose/melibiose transport system substrate-binding protein